MHMVCMEIAKRLRNVRQGREILRRESRIALRLPPEPVLHQEIKRDMLRAVLGGHVEQLPG